MAKIYLSDVEDLICFLKTINPNKIIVCDKNSCSFGLCVEETKDEEGNNILLFQDERENVE